MGARYVLCHLVRCVVLSQKSITVSSYDMVFEATFFLKKKDMVLKPLYLDSSDKCVGKESRQVCRHHLDRSR
jgi:hypothetical protein